MRDFPGPQRLEERDEAVGNGDAARFVAAARRVSPRVAAPVAAVLALFVADRVGFSVPGGRYARRVLDDPLVFLAVRLLVITLIAVAIARAWWRRGARSRTGRGSMRG
jgi:hypothetical protein